MKKAEKIVRKGISYVKIYVGKGERVRGKKGEKYEKTAGGRNRILIIEAKKPNT